VIWISPLEVVVVVEKRELIVELMGQKREKTRAIRG